MESIGYGNEVGGGGDCDGCHCKLCLLVRLVELLGNTYILGTRIHEKSAHHCYIVREVRILAGSTKSQDPSDPPTLTQ